MASDAAAFDFESLVHAPTLHQAARSLIHQHSNAQQHARSSAMPQHPSPTVRLLQQQILHARSPATSGGSVASSEVPSGRPRRAASNPCGKRRRLDDSSSVPGSEECDEEDDAGGESDDASPARRGKAAGTPFVRPPGMSAAEAKRLRRQQQNRDAAATSRHRKKAYLQSLESRNEALEAEARQLKSMLQQQARQIEAMQRRMDAGRGKHDHTNSHASADPATNQQPPTIDLAYTSPHSPSDSSSEGVHSSAPTSPMSSQDQFHSDSSSHSFTPPSRSVAPLHITVAPVLLDDQLMADAALPPLASPKFAKQPSLDMEHLQLLDSVIGITHAAQDLAAPHDSPYLSIFQSATAELVSQSPPAHFTSAAFHLPAHPSSAASLRHSSSMPASCSSLSRYDPAAIVHNQQCCERDGKMGQAATSMARAASKTDMRLVQAATWCVWQIMIWWSAMSSNSSSSTAMLQASSSSRSSTEQQAVSSPSTSPLSIHRPLPAPFRPHSQPLAYSISHHHPLPMAIACA